MPPDQFTTARLSVGHWQSTLADPEARRALESALPGLLTPDVLKHLPAPLQLASQPGAVTSWVDARARESDVYRVDKRDSGELVGLLILATGPGDEGSVHIGYMLAETAWGQGIASELLRGLVGAMKGGGPARLLGGVDRANPASARVLRKAGFVREPALSTTDTDIFVRDMV